MGHAGAGPPRKRAKTAHGREAIDASIGGVRQRLLFKDATVRAFRVADARKSVRQRTFCTENGYLDRPAFLSVVP